MDEADVDQLYRDEPEGFVAARDALARRLRQEGDREGAARVKALRRPSRVAWALNQLRDDRPDELAELLAVGADLREAQEAAMRGEEAAGLREATARRRALVRSLAKAAGRRLGGSQAGAGGIEATLDAAVLDPAIGDLLAAGRLDREREVAGFGAFGDLGALADVVPLRPRAGRTARTAPEAGSEAAPKRASEGATERAGGGAARDQAAERRQAERRRAADEARAAAAAAADEARAAAAAAAEEVAAARERAEEAAAAVEAAEAALADARAAARAARTEVGAAERRARAAEAARERAEAAERDAAERDASG